MRYCFPRFPEGRSRAMTFSYDDGCESDPRLAKILSDNGMKGTFNLMCMFYDKDNREEYINRFKTEILDRGHEIAVHGYYHRAPAVQRPINGIRDVLECRLTLEKCFGGIIRGMAYPDTGITRFANGATYADIRGYLSDLGIVYSRTLGNDNSGFYLPDDWFAWVPTAHHSNPKLMDWVDQFLALDNLNTGYPAAANARLFYLWGHTYEFERDNNWDRIESFCEKASGNPDIWYATNIEIYDYMHAYQSLLFSADEKTIYNQTLYKIWFYCDKEIYSIEPGQTLTL